MIRTVTLITVLAVSVLILVATSCKKDDTENPAVSIPTSTSISPSPTATQPLAEIVIGNLTDQTGVSAATLSIIDQALDDMVDYYNKHNLIPGIKLKTVIYDTQYDPAQAKIGYEYLKNKGADVIWSPAPHVIPVLKPVADRDKFPVFVASTQYESVMPPGYVFSLGTIPQHEAYTLLEWIAENHWDYQSNGPARIGGASWSDGYTDIVFMGMKEYAQAHPDQYDWAGSYLTNFSFDWSSEIEMLKDCDYIWPPTPMQVFVRDYTRAGYHTTFVGADGTAGFMGMIDEGNQWDEIDGMLFIRGSRWWTETGPIIDLTNDLLETYHSDKADGIRRSGVGYLAAAQIYQLCNIIQSAAENVGSESVNSQSIYEAAIEYTENIEGIERYSFTETKRCSTNYAVVYKVDGERKDLFRADPDWIPVVTEP